MLRVLTLPAESAPADFLPVIRQDGKIEKLQRSDYARRHPLSNPSTPDSGLRVPAFSIISIILLIPRSLRLHRRDICQDAARSRHGKPGAAARQTGLTATLLRMAVAMCALLALMPAARPAAAQDAPSAVCPGNPDALKTSRVLTVDAAAMPRVGRKHFPDTLPLADKEVVLTFDDGPQPGTTNAVLDTLKRECVLATFFLIGRNAAAHPELAKRELAEGHTVAHHSFSHPLLDRMQPESAEADIDRGFAAVDKALYGNSGDLPRTPFFRFPGFASTPHLLDRLAARHIVVFGADVWASDWNQMTPDQELGLVLSRIEAAHGGIVLFHDTKRQTAAMLPAFLRSLKTRGYRIVHVVAPAT
jgi:peptidoglycan/xylan/chitin deacetylase (PgdA/CDA1 family)